MCISINHVNGLARTLGLATEVTQLYYNMVIYLRNEALYNYFAGCLTRSLSVSSSHHNRCAELFKLVPSVEIRNK